LVYVSIAAVEILTSWAEFEYSLHSDCSKPIHVWLLVAFALMILLRTADLVAFNEARIGWRRRSVCHFQICFYILLTLFTYWLLRGTLWFYELKAQANICFDPRQFSIWVLLMYAVLVYYVTAVLRVMLGRIQEREEEEMRLVLLGQYVDSMPPVSVVERHWEERGLSPGSISSLPLREINESEEGQYVCSICLEEVRKRERVRELGCGHVFHIGCIDEWLVRRSHCPNCNLNLDRRVVDSF
jgi:uncharacterized protein YhhL (DUF1145 family)